MPNCAAMTEASVLAIVPAAGQSSRLGQPKQLIEYQGKTLLSRCVDNVHAVCDDVLVVTGAYLEQVTAALAPTTPGVHNPDWRAGLGTSLACGVARAVAGDYDAVLVVLPDQPLIGRNDLERLLAESGKYPGQVVCAGYAGTRGVPAILPRRLFGDVLALQGDRGAHDIIAGEPGARVIPMATAAVDIDTPADLARLPA